MSKYINADQLCEDLMSRWEIADKEKEKEIQSIMADIVVPIVIGQPSADVVEVVRCKDCAHGDAGVSGVWCYLYAAYRRSDAFCDNGERKETE